MDDRSAHFFALVGEVCESARLAQLPVHLLLLDGTRLEGHPRAHLADEGEPLAETGYADAIHLGDRRIPLSDVVEATVHRP